MRASGGARRKRPLCRQGNYRERGPAELRLDIAGIQLPVNGNDAGGRQYESRSSHGKEKGRENF